MCRCLCGEEQWLSFWGAGALNEYAIPQAGLTIFEVHKLTGVCLCGTEVCQNKVKACELPLPVVKRLSLPSN